MNKLLNVSPGIAFGIVANAFYDKLISSKHSQSILNVNNLIINQNLYQTNGNRCQHIIATNPKIEGCKILTCCPDLRSCPTDQYAEDTEEHDGCHT